MIGFPLILPAVLAAIVSAVGSLFGVGVNAITNAKKNKQLTGAENEANAFSAEQADLARQFQAGEAENTRNFNAQQAEIGRQFEEYMYNQYNSPQAQIRQYQDAGINSALMYGGHVFTSAPDSAPVASSGIASAPGFAQSSLGSRGNLLDNAGGIISSLVNLAQLKADIDETRSRTDLNRATIENETAKTAAYAGLTLAQEDEIASRIELNHAYKSESEAHAYLALVDSLLKSKDFEWFDKMRSTELAYTEARTASERQSVKESEAQTYELFARALQEKANAGLLDQETLNAAVENNILRLNVQSGQFQVDHQDADRKWNKVRVVTGALQDAGIGIGSVVAGVGKAVGSAAGSYVGARNAKHIH